MILEEESPACGHRGRVRRVFWREVEPWIVLRCHNGLLLSVPWQWTDLPVPAICPSHPAEPLSPALLSSQSLIDLVRFVRYHAGNHRSPRRGEKGDDDDSRARAARGSSGLHASRGEGKEHT